ncbi:MAG: tetratricopeptide repeat protein [Elusimicrobiota bacterium]|jgi:tetratricopeptide (TPR) repeat protein
MTHGAATGWLGGPLALLLAAGPSWAGPGLPIPGEWRACREDRDCIAVAEDCCPPGARGGRAAINRERRSEYEVVRASACASGAACRPISTRRQDWEAGLKPSCRSAKCCLIEGLPLDQWAQEDIREQEKRDTAWLEGLRKSAIGFREADAELAKPGLSPRKEAKLKARRLDHLTELDKAARANATNYLAQFYLGQVFLSVGEHRRALACAAKSAELAPRDARTIVLRGLAYWKLGRRAEAAADAKEALRLDPGFKPALDLQAMTSGPHPR